MKKILLLLCLGGYLFAETGNQATIADLKEAVYKLILLNEKNHHKKVKVIYKPLHTSHSYLDKYIKAYVEKNKSYLPKK